MRTRQHSIRARVADIRRPGYALLLVIAVLLVALVFLASATGLGGRKGSDEAGSGGPVATPRGLCPGERFADVCPGDWYYPYVTAVAGAGAMTGYPDGTFQPGNSLSRGQWMKVLVLATGLQGLPPSTYTFADMPPDQAIFPWVEIGSAHGLATGYPCGGPGEPCDSANRAYFRPGGLTNRGLLAKTLALALNWQPETSGQAFADVPPGSAFYGYADKAVSMGVVGGYACGGPGEPCDAQNRPFFRPSGTATRAQASKMLALALRLPLPEPPPTPTVRPGGSGVSARDPLPCPLWPADNIWNRRVDSLPTLAASDAYVATMHAGDPLHAGFGSSTWEGLSIGVTYNVVPRSQPLVPVTFTDYPDQSDAGPYPFPTSALIQGATYQNPVPTSGDRHVSILRAGDCTLFETWHSSPNPDGSWNAANGAIFHLNSNALRPDGWTSGDAAGFAILPGLLRYDEVEAGAVTHAIRFTAEADTIRDSWTWPARHTDGASSSPDAPPMGTRFRLKASVDLSGFSPRIRTILQGLKTYGMMLADSGDSWQIGGAVDRRWDDEEISELTRIHGSDFEAVDVSGLMIDSDSGQSR